jgi:hypothetical protein
MQIQKNKEDSAQHKVLQDFAKRPSMRSSLTDLNRSIPPLVPLPSAPPTLTKPIIPVGSGLMHTKEVIFLDKFVGHPSGFVPPPPPPPFILPSTPISPPPPPPQYESDDDGNIKIFF